MTHDDDALTCDICGRHLNADKGEAFLRDDGGVYCNDHIGEADAFEAWVEQHAGCPVYHPKPGWVESFHEGEEA